MYTHGVRTHIAEGPLDCFHLPRSARVELRPAHLFCVCVSYCLLSRQASIQSWSRALRPPQYLFRHEMQKNNVFKREKKHSMFVVIAC